MDCRIRINEKWYLLIYRDRIEKPMCRELYETSVPSEFLIKVEEIPKSIPIVLKPVIELPVVTAGEKLVKAMKNVWARLKTRLGQSKSGSPTQT